MTPASKRMTSGTFEGDPSVGTLAGRSEVRDVDDWCQSGGVVLKHFQHIAFTHGAIADPEAVSICQVQPCEALKLLCPHAVLRVDARPATVVRLVWTPGPASEPNDPDIQGILLLYF